MTDPDLIKKKLALVETCVADLRRLARPAELAHDLKEERFVEHTLQMAIQAALDVASHIVSDRRLGEPRTNRELFDLLERDGWIHVALRDTLRNIVGFRNVLVHGYLGVDSERVHELLNSGLDDFVAFGQHVESYLIRINA